MSSCLSMCIKQDTERQTISNLQSLYRKAKGFREHTLCYIFMQSCYTLGPYMPLRACKNSFVGLFLFTPILANDHAGEILVRPVKGPLLDNSISVKPVQRVLDRKLDRHNTPKH